LQRREKEGSVYEGDQRVITFRASTFQLIIEKVREMAGNIVAQTIFYQIGIAIGRRTFEYSKDEEITSDNLANVIDGVLNLRGWGRVVSLRMKEASNEVTYEYTFRECIICHKYTAQQPICDVVRGIFVGWLESFLGKKATSSVEKQCRAMGKDFCIFDITFAKP
jgi:predicted hydrocarbon binding protein